MSLLLFVYPKGNKPSVLKDTSAQD